MSLKAYISDGGYASMLAGALAAVSIAVGTLPDAAANIGLYSDLTAGAEKLGMAVGGIQGPVFTRSGAAVNSTFPGSLSAMSLTATGLTTGRIPIISTGGLLVDSATLLYNSATAQMTIGAGALNPVLALVSSAGQTRALDFYTAATLRWRFRCTATAEGGANAGSDWALTSYDDAGVQIDNPILVTRAAAGTMAFTRSLTCSNVTNATAFGTASVALTGGLSVAKATWTAGLLIGDSADTTKRVTWNLAGMATSTTLTLTAPAFAASRILNYPLITATDTLASLGLAQTFSADQTFTGQIVSTLGYSGAVSEGASSLFLNYTVTPTGAIATFQHAMFGRLTIANTAFNLTDTSFGQITQFIGWRHSGTGAIAQGSGLMVFPDGNATGGSVTDYRYITLRASSFNATTVGTLTGLYVPAMTAGGTANYAIFTAGAGIVKIQDTTSAASAILGAVVVGNGTAATSVGIGAGKVNIGSTLDVASTVTLAGPLTQTYSPGTGLTAMKSVATYTATGSQVAGDWQLVGTPAGAMGAFDQYSAFRAWAKSTGAIAVPYLAGATCRVETNTAGNTTWAFGFQTFIQNSGSGALADAASVYVQAPSNTGGGSITRQYGVYIEALTVAGTNYAFFTAGAGLFKIQDTTDASAIGTAGVVTTSGLSVAKRSFLGTIGSTFKGNVLAGVQDATAASAGQVGEVLSATLSAYTNYTTTATYQQVATLSLTAGDWDIVCFGSLAGNGATLTVTANGIFTLSTTTASAAGTTEGSGDIAYISQVFNAASGRCSIVLHKRVNINATTSYFLNSQSTFTAGNPQFVGSIVATRVR